MPLDDLYNPQIHRINRALQARALDPEAAVVPATGILTQFRHPPERLVGQAQSRIDALIKLAEVKKGRPRLSLLARGSKPTR